MADLSYEYLPFTAADADVKKAFDFSGAQYKLRLRQNNIESSFSMDVFDADDNLIYNSRLNYGQPFAVSKYANLPFNIIPYDVSALTGNATPETSITAENLGVTVQLYTTLVLA